MDFLFVAIESYTTCIANAWNAISLYERAYVVEGFTFSLLLNTHTHFRIKQNNLCCKFEQYQRESLHHIPFDEWVQLNLFTYLWESPSIDVSADFLCKAPCEVSSQCSRNRVTVNWKLKFPFIFRKLNFSRTDQKQSQIELSFQNYNMKWSSIKT